MSVRLSVTTMTSIATMLKAATATISSRMSDIMVFSMRIGAEVVGVVLRPVAHLERRPAAARAAARPPPAPPAHRCTRTRRPSLAAPAGRQRPHVLEVGEHQRAVVILQAHLEDAGHRELAQLRCRRAVRAHRRHQHRQRVAGGEPEALGDHRADDDAHPDPRLRSLEVPLR